jgi:periplasmic divalent cation tolerance protein
MAKKTKSSICFIYVTCPNAETAERLAQHAVQEKLAACANILPQMLSIYHWQGRIESAQETVLILKSEKRLYKKVERRLLELHPYDCPCIVHWPIEQGSAAYLDWIKNELKAIPQAQSTSAQLRSVQHRSSRHPRKKLRSK